MQPRRVATRRLLLRLRLRRGQAEHDHGGTSDTCATNDFRAHSVSFMSGSQLQC